MHIECRQCLAKGPACGRCVVSSLLDAPGSVEWDDTERAALAALARSGLIPPLRLRVDAGCVSVR